MQNTENLNLLYNKSKAKSYLIILKVHLLSRIPGDKVAKMRKKGEDRIEFFLFINCQRHDGNFGVYPSFCYIKYLSGFLNLNFKFQPTDFKNFQINHSRTNY